MTKRVPKVWGEEEIICNEARPGCGYAGKRMTLKPGFQCSLHFHPVKHETFWVERGWMLLELGPAGTGVSGADHLEIRRLGPGDVVTIPPSTVHRFTGLGSDETVFFEFSTLDAPEDSVRLEPSGPVAL